VNWPGLVPVPPAVVTEIDTAPDCVGGTATISVDDELVIAAAGTVPNNTCGSGARLLPLIVTGVEFAVPLLGEIPEMDGGLRYVNCGASGSELWPSGVDMVIATAPATWAGLTAVSWSGELKVTLVAGAEPNETAVPVEKKSEPLTTTDVPPDDGPTGVLIDLTCGAAIVNRLMAVAQFWRSLLAEENSPASQTSVWTGWYEPPQGPGSTVALA